jgi:NAD(P)-dependent dehydrogenase (short-subunit alcohol dehydrogenase family)
MSTTATSIATPEQQVAVITGGGTGLGLATGLELRSRGFRVLAFGLDTERELEGSGIEFEKLDITDEGAMSGVASRLPRINALINAAGIIQQGGAEFTISGFRKVVDVNLNGTQLACILFRSALAAGRGSIVNFASMWSYFGSARNPAYTASKGAIVSLTRSLAVAYAVEGIRVNAVAPGWIETRMSQAVFADPVRSAAIKTRLPMGYWGQAYDIAKAAAFLVSADARYITGVTLPVDGGYSVA